MYRLEYVKKRKRRRLVAIVAAVSTVVVTTFCIVAFLGRFVGTFTVSLETRNVDLTLLEKLDSKEHSSFLRINDMPAFQEYTYSYFDRDFSDEEIDNEDSVPFMGANYEGDALKSINFFKYTYYVKNVGANPAIYDWSINILDDVLSDDGRSLLSTLRVMIYVDGEKSVYGLRDSVPHVDEHGNPSYSAPISVSEEQASTEFPFMGYAKEFNSSEVVTTFRGQKLNVGEAKRYTIVTWLEGFRSSNNEFAPRGAKIKLGVEINAYENE